MVDHWCACDDDIPVEYKRPEDVMLGLQMVSEGFSRKAGATNLACNTSTLRRCCAEPCLLANILLLCLGNSYLPRQTRHDFRLFGIRPEADPFKEADEGIET